MGEEEEGLVVEMSWDLSLLKRNNGGGPPLGLRNLGNSCYLNSVLQCLTYTPSLANFCLRFLHSSSCDTAIEPGRKRECPFCILEKRIVRSLSVDLSIDAPSKLHSCLRLFSENFKCGRQEDAHEFLRYVLDACHNTCLRLKKMLQQCVWKRFNGDGECFGSNTIVKEIFGGALQSQVKCLSCGNESNKVDEIMDICLEVSGSSSLKDAMRIFFQAEVLDGNNKYKCERCKKLVTARKQMSILQAPNVLVVQLKRFEGIFGGKIDKIIAFEEILVLSSFLCKASHDLQPEYSLFATIVHSGFSPESGHYYAYVKNAAGRWYCCNDSYVTLSTLQEVLSEKAYILFFTRTSQRPVAAGVSNGLKSLESNDRTASVSNGVTTHEDNDNMRRSPKSISPRKTTNMISSDERSIGKSIPFTSKVIDSSTVLQNKFNGLADSFTKRNSPSSNENVNAQRKKPVGCNGNGSHTTQKQLNVFSISTLANGNGIHTNGKKIASVNGQVFGNGNGHFIDGAVGSVKQNLHEDNALREEDTARKWPANGATNNVSNHGRVDISGSKRKLEDRDTCILFARDAQSRAQVEEFKIGLQKEASLVLQSCGWPDKLYKYMRSRKKICLDACTSTDTNEQKRLLISDAKPTFISQIPGSVKGSLIERILSFSRGK